MRVTFCISLLVLSTSVSASGRILSSNFQQTIRQANLKNAAYENIASTLQSDEEGLEISEDDISDFTIETSFGDLTGDGAEEAAVTTHYYVGGTGASGRTKILVFTLEGGELRLLGRVVGGDRAFGGIRSARIRNRQLHVETFTPNEGECALCYGGVILTKYEPLGGRLVKVQSSYLGDMVETTNRRTGQVEWVLKPRAAGKASRRRRNR